MIRSRDRSSSQMLTPSAVSCSVGVLMRAALLAPLRGGDGLACRLDDGVGGDAELLEQGLVVGGRAEVLDRDASGRLSPTMPRQVQGDAGLDRHAGGDGLPAARDSRYASSCSANHSSDGADTTRALMPSAASVSRAATASCTSEPVPMRITSGVPFGASARTYAPLAALSAEANTSPDAVALAAREHRDVLAGQREAGGAGVAAEQLEPDDGGLVRVRRAHHREVRDGAQSVASCSIGWWVGPSSPRATESCVQT